MLWRLKPDTLYRGRTIIDEADEDIAFIDRVPPRQHPQLNALASSIVDDHNLFAMPGRKPVKIAILTGSELRHRFFRKALSVVPGIDCRISICEGLQGSLTDSTANRQDVPLQAAHVDARARSEQDFFGAIDRYCPDRSRPRQVERGEVNGKSVLDLLWHVDPDVIISYGCSILRDDYLQRYRDRTVNVHLGLSPYYRGAGTNFWPLVEGRPEFVGATFMRIDAGIDTGEIIHQRRASFLPTDGSHQIGNRLIGDIVADVARIALHFHELERPPAPAAADIGKLYRKKDLTEQSFIDLASQFGAGMIIRYLEAKVERDAAAPIVSNPLLKGAGA